MDRKKEYQKYLNSDEWRQQRDLALFRTDGFCQFCSELATQVHHVKYPKTLGHEHPDTLIPVCKKCHDISHGVQKMNHLIDVQQMTEITPSGGHLKYLLSGARIYASAKSWERALQVPSSMSAWFESGLPRTAILKKDSSGGALEMTYLNTAVYRWHAVADLLRSFDRNWHNHQYSSRPKSEQTELKKFHDNYESLISWGYDLQERALSSALVSAPRPTLPVSQDDLLRAIKDAVAPRIHQHDEKLKEHDLIISEIKDAIPTLRDPGEFITIKQAILEQGLDPSLMPLHPHSNENLSALTGQILAERHVEKGDKVASRIDGQSIVMPLNTYRRGEIYKVLTELLNPKQVSLKF